MRSCSAALSRTVLLDDQRKGFVLFLSPFRGSFFHQGLQWFLLLLFLTVLAFAHDRYSLMPSLAGSAKRCLSIDCTGSASKNLGAESELTRSVPAGAGHIDRIDRRSQFAADYAFSASSLAHASATRLSALSSSGMIAQRCFSM